MSENTDEKASFFSFIAESINVGDRLDKFLGDAMRDESVSREKLKKSIKEGQVSINGAVCKVPKTKLASGDEVVLELILPPSAVVPEEGDLEILFRDKHLVVLNKPAGLTVHPCPSCPDGTLVHRLVHHFPELVAMEGFRPGIVHRLDKDTSGLIMVALTEEARLKLTEAFANRTVHKEYIALVHGVPKEEQAVINEPMGRHPSMKVKMAVVKGGKEACSEYKVLYAAEDASFSLTAVRIYTGRTHQIRVHMSHIGYPLWGDSLYGGGVPGDSKYALVAQRQMLHAWRLQCLHPITGEQLTFSCPPPDDFAELATALSQRMQRVVVTGMPGCGKSAVIERLKSHNIPVWSADEAVHTLYDVGGEAWFQLRGRYGDAFVPDDEPVNRKALFTAMQESVSVRKEVEDIVHPLVRYDLERFWKEHAESLLSVAEIPLFLETGWKGDTDVLVGINCPRDIRVERLESNRGWSEDVLASMEAWQWPEQDKMAACDVLVDNSGDLAALDANVATLLDELSLRRKNAVQGVLDTLHSLWNAGN